MKKYDVIVIYNSTQANSAGDHTYSEGKPFAQDKKYLSHNKTYAYFLMQCARKRLRAGFATTDDILEDGTIKHIWTYSENEWHRETGPIQTSFVFDKFSVKADQNSDAYDLLDVDGGSVRLFHNRTARTLFDNKYETYTNFPALAIPTAQVGTATRENVRSARKRLRMKVTKDGRIDHKKRYILKDQFGAGGSNIYSFQHDTPFVPHDEMDEIPFIMQPRIDATGFEFDKHNGTIDLRVIVVEGKIIQSYIRIAVADEFRANASLGGEVAYINPRKISTRVKDAVKSIHTRLPEGTSFYALDFIKNPDGKIFLVEGNITPGIIWFNEEDEKYAKKLIRLMVKKIKKRLK